MTYKMPIPDCYDAIQDLNCYSAERMLEAYKAGAEQERNLKKLADLGQEIDAALGHEYEGTLV